MVNENEQLLNNTMEKMLIKYYAFSCVCVGSIFSIFISFLFLFHFNFYFRTFQALTGSWISVTVVQHQKAQWCNGAEM